MIRSLPATHGVPRSWTLPLVLVTTLALVAPSVTLARGEGAIVVRKDRVVRLGAMNLRHGTALRTAIRAFGHPSSRRDRRHGGCLVRWRRAGLVADFENFGFVPPDRSVCGPRYGLLQSAEVTGRRWRTDRGLARGDSKSQLLGLYPYAERHGRTFSLEEAFFPYGDGGDSWIVRANMNGHGSVRSFSVWVGGAGE